MSPVCIFDGAPYAMSASIVLNMSGVRYLHFSIVGEMRGRRISEHKTVMEFVWFTIGRAIVHIAIGPILYVYISLCLVVCALNASLCVFILK